MHMYVTMGCKLFAYRCRIYYLLLHFTSNIIHSWSFKEVGTLSFIFDPILDIVTQLYVAVKIVFNNLYIIQYLLL